jgi:hypothetical protein
MTGPVDMALNAGRRVEVVDHGAFGIAVALIFDCECRHVVWTGHSHAAARSEAREIAAALGWAMLDRSRPQ